MQEIIWEMSCITGPQQKHASTEPTTHSRPAHPHIWYFKLLYGFGSFSKTCYVFVGNMKFNEQNEE